MVLKPTGRRSLYLSLSSLLTLSLSLSLFPSRLIQARDVKGVKQTWSGLRFADNVARSSAHYDARMHFEIHLNARAEIRRQHLRTLLEKEGGKVGR